MNGNPINIIIQLMNQGQNPQQIIQQMVAQNPQLQVLLNQAQQSGMSPQEYVKQYAKQNNINIEPLVNIFSQKGIKL